jgi:hypothetical protein
MGRIGICLSALVLAGCLGDTSTAPSAGREAEIEADTVRAALAEERARLIQAAAAEAAARSADTEKSLSLGTIEPQPDCGVAEGSSPLAAPPQLNPEQIQSLAAVVLGFTPEHTHFSSGARFAWMVLGSRTDPGAPAIGKEVTRQIEQRYQVFNSLEDVPDAWKIQHAKGWLMGLEGGFKFEYVVRFYSPTLMRVDAEDWESGLSASGNYGVFEWKDCSWQRRCRHRIWIS